MTDPMKARDHAQRITHCSHGRRYTEPCDDCKAVWRAMCIEILAKQATRMGFRLVPEPEAADE